MNNKELDKWIAENVMCLDVSKYPIVHESVDINSRSVYVWVEKIPKYTTDPAAAMEVLKKCAIEIEKDKTMISGVECYAPCSTDGKSKLWCVMEATGSLNAEAETLELAICLFAKKLFGKSERN